MNADCLAFRLTDEERQRFEEQGYFFVKDALAPEHVERLAAAVDRIHTGKRKEGLGEQEGLFFPNFIHEDEAFLELIDWPRTFPKVWGILGWNIYLYHSHLGVHPPRDPALRADRKPLGWHQDSARVNLEIECTPRPRLSLKIGYFLSDVSQPGRGNMHVIPGSHRQDEIPPPPDDGRLPPSAIPVCVTPGTAVFFDRRLWHAGSPNDSSLTRKVLFYGYAYRWLRPKDDMTVEHLYPRLDPIRRQILGDGVNANGHYKPRDGDVPLKDWLERL